MKSFLVKTIRFFGKLLGKKNASAIIVFLFKATDAPLMTIALNQYGILKGNGMYNSGEEFVIKSLFKELIQHDEDVIDIGANIGTYALTLNKYLKNNRIISVEPNRAAFNELQKNVPNECFNYAISSDEGEKSFFVSKENPKSTLGSLSQETVPKSETLKEIRVNCIRLDNFVKIANIDKIGVLKIDTEGFDFDVLKSGEGLLKDIKFIQFEFSQFHVFTRSFIKDFHDLLSPTHSLYRLDTTSLHDINKYDSQMEIFRLQNILAVRKDLTLNISQYIKA